MRFVLHCGGNAAHLQSRSALASADQASIAFYDAEAARYAERAHGKKDNPRLAAFAKSLPAGGLVLDLGCGGGQDSLAFLELGFDVVALDASPRIAAEAERRTGLKVRIARFDELDDQSTFDGIWASASLHHVPAAALADIFARINHALQHGGMLFASFKVGHIDRRDRFGGLYCEMSEKQLRALVADPALWRDVQIDHAKGSGYDNEPTNWLMLTARRA